MMNKYDERSIERYKSFARIMKEIYKSPAFLYESITQDK